MIAERDGKFFLIIRKGSVENKPDGRHCIEETIEKEITELEFLRYMVRELEADIADMKRQPPGTVSYPICPCPYPCPKTEPFQPVTPPWTNGQPLWYVDPTLQPTCICGTGGSTQTVTSCEVHTR